jgi:type IV pilus assembly protein PilA
LSAQTPPRLASSSRQAAFTLVELLVVILIIGILIAIAVPTFLNQQQKAQNSAAQQTLAVAYKDAKANMATNGGTFSDYQTLASQIASAEPEYTVGTAIFSSDQAVTAGPYGKLWVLLGSTGSNGTLASTNGQNLYLADVSKSGAVCTLTVTNDGPPVYGGCGGTSSGSAGATTPAAVVAPSGANGPTISGTAEADYVLTASAGSGWAGSPTFTYQWQDCNSVGSACSNISGSTSSTYTVVQNDVSHTIDVVVTGTNGASSAMATSAPTSVVTSNPADILQSNIIASYPLNETSFDSPVTDASGNGNNGSYFRYGVDPVRYAIDSEGYVHLTGLANAVSSYVFNTASSVVGTLPAADRPTQNEMFQGLLYDSAASGGGYKVNDIEIYTNGQIDLIRDAGSVSESGASGSWQSLDNIVFPSSSVSQTAITPTAGYWQNFSSAWSALSATKDANGIVHLNGLVTNPTAVTMSGVGDVIGYLPTGDAPSAEVLGSGSCYDQRADDSCRVDITNAGAIILEQSMFLTTGSPATNTFAAGSFVSLAGISFPASSNNLTWTGDNFTSPWENYSTGFSTGQYAKDSDGIVYLQGLITPSSTCSANLFTVPPADAPGADTLTGGAYAQAAGPLLYPRVDIGQNGQVIYAGDFNGSCTTSGGPATVTWVALDTSYPAATNRLNWQSLTNNSATNNPSYWNDWTPDGGVAVGQVGPGGSGAITLDFTNYEGGLANLFSPTEASGSTGSASIWVKTANTDSSNYQGALAKYGAWGIFTRGGMAEAYDWYTSTALNSGVNIANNTWHMLTLTYTTGNECLYVDAVNKGCDTSWQPSTESASVLIGAGYTLPPAQAGGQTWDGSLSQASLYSVVLTQAQISKLYAAQ